MALNPGAIVQKAQDFFSWGEAEDGKDDAYTEYTDFEDESARGTKPSPCLSLLMKHLWNYMQKLWPCWPLKGGLEFQVYIDLTRYSLPVNRQQILKGSVPRMHKWSRLIKGLHDLWRAHISIVWSLPPRVWTQPGCPSGEWEQRRRTMIDFVTVEGLNAATCWFLLLNSVKWFVWFYLYL